MKGNIASMELIRRIARKIRHTSFQFLYPHWPAAHSFLFFQVRRQVARITGPHTNRSQHNTFLPGLKPYLGGPESYSPLVSVVVPCYNHAPYLERRLLSIQQQTYQNFEVILLDDASSDGSHTILEAHVKRYPEKARLISNSENSGTAFRQWAKGLEEAKGELVWIAESDDFCDPDFLETLVPIFSNRAVMLAMGRTIFVDHNGKQPVWSLEEYLPELGINTWEQPFVDYAQRLVAMLWARRNLLPNASSCLFRKPRHHQLLDQPWWQGLRVCGDWLFYLELCRCGLVAYTPETRSYYRQHPGNSSVSQHKQRLFFEEHLLAARWICSTYNLSANTITALQSELSMRWPASSLGPISKTDEARIQALATEPEGKPNLLIVTYALVGGGGEVFPLRLANGLRAAGYGVAVLSCDQKPCQPEVEAMVHGDVPIYTLERLQDLGHLVHQLDLGIVHTHHAWVDTTCAELLSEFPGTAHVVTSHGMYDYMDNAELVRIGRILGPKTSQISYVAETNRAALLQLGFTPERLQHINNAVPHRIIQPIERSQLGIPDDSFLLCLVSRAMAEKGWHEAIEATNQLRTELRANIHLLLIGDGLLADQLREEHKDRPYIHFLGFKPNTLDYFAGSDLGILPTRFAGESQPLTLIECLQAGTPYVASRIGQIEAMLSCGAGLAGSLVDLDEGYCRPGALANAIKPYVLNSTLLADKRLIVQQAAQKFSWSKMLNAYEDLYQLSYQNRKPQVLK